MSAGPLLIISCSENNPRLDPGQYFNLSAANTQVIKTSGGRVESAINNIYYADHSTRLGMIIIVQHDNCAASPGNVEANVRADIQMLKNSPYVRNEIPIIGYVLDLETSQLREVNVPRNEPDTEARRRVLNQMEDFGPFWS